MNRPILYFSFREAVSLISLLCVLVVLSACGGGGGDSSGTSTPTTATTPTATTPTATTPTVTTPTTSTASVAATYENYNKAVASVSTAAQTFLPAVQKWEGSDFTKMTIAEIKTITKSYTDSGNQFVASLNAVNSAATAVKKPVEKTVAAGGLPSGASVSPTLPIAVGGVIKETITSVADLDNQLSSGKIDENEYKTQIDKLRKTKTLKAVGVGVSTIVGIAGGAVVGAGLTLAAAPAAIVIGGGILAAAAVGKTISWFWNSACGANKVALATTAASSCTMSSGQTTSGASIPSQMVEGGTMTISIPGYVPVVITNFKPPKSGNQLNIDFTPTPVDKDNPNAIITIDYNETTVKATTCSQILSITGLPSPLDPGPSQSVTVTATVFPVIAGCDISFKITGTDSYSNSATTKTNASGQSTFYIPGGATGVHDTVSMGANGKTHVVTYTF